MALDQVMTTADELVVAPARKQEGRSTRSRAESASSGFAFQRHAEAAKRSDYLKRGVDVAVGGLLLIAAAPIFAAVAVVVKLDSPGPVIVRQVRVGKGLRRFQLYKFRSMLEDAPALQNEIRSFNEAAWPLFKMRRDPRVTRVGRILRKSSLDELPQLINVVRGDMSLVGPRPPLPDELEADFVRQAQRMRAVPGMTGLWQVSGRSDLDYSQMIRLDLRYTRVRSVLLDLAILVRTIPAALSGKGAY